jgi:hypothetical protein
MNIDGLKAALGAANSRIETLEIKLEGFEILLTSWVKGANEHYHTDITKAHPRNGSVAEVHTYLGF